MILSIVFVVIGSPIDFNAVSASSGSNSVSGGGVIDTSQLMVDFHKCKSVLVNHNCVFVIDTKDNNVQGDVKVVITSKFEDFYFLPFNF